MKRCTIIFIIMILSWYGNLHALDSDKVETSGSDAKACTEVIKKLLLASGDLEMQPQLDDIEITFDNKKNNIRDPGSLLVNDAKLLEVSKRNHRFSAAVWVGEQSGQSNEVTIHGWFKEYARLPVLKNNIKAGEIIQEKNIKEAKFDTAKLRENIIFDKAQLVGNTPRYNLAADQPIKSSAIVSPRVVNKGDLVNIVYEHNNLVLKLEGVALDAGAVGDSIRIKNPRSDTVLYAVIEGRNIARIHAKTAN